MYGRRWVWFSNQKICRLLFWLLLLPYPSVAPVGRPTSSLDMFAQALPLRCLSRCTSNGHAVHLEFGLAALFVCSPDVLIHSAPGAKGQKHFAACQIVSHPTLLLFYSVSSLFFLSTFSLIPFLISGIYRWEWWVVGLWNQGYATLGLFHRINWVRQAESADHTLQVPNGQHFVF